MTNLENRTGQVDRNLRESETLSERDRNIRRSHYRNLQHSLTFD